MTSARQVFARSRNTTLRALVDVYLAELGLRQGRAAEARKRAASALRVFSRQRLATRSAGARLIQARAMLEVGQLTSAALQAKAALRLIRNQYAPALEYQCHHVIGEISRRRGNSRRALESLRRAVDKVERMRGGIAADQFKTTFLKDKIQVYEGAISLCLDKGTPKMIDEAFRLVESSKSRALADLFARYLRNPAGRGQASESRARLQRLIDDLNWYSSQAGLEDDKGDQRSADTAERYRKAIVRCERQIARLFRLVEGQNSVEPDLGLAPAAAASDLQQVLEPGETAVEYFSTGDELSAFVASRDRISVVRNFASRLKVEQVLGSLRFQLEKFNYGAAYVESNFSQLRRAPRRTLQPGFCSYRK